jgi:hypothetical protein
MKLRACRQHANAASTTTNIKARSTAKTQLGRVKCNIDVSFSSIWNCTKIGICLRNDDAAYMLAKTMSFSPIYPVEVGEALGLLDALQWL